MSVCAKRYQLVAESRGTTIVRASTGVSERIGGAITVLPLARASAEHLATELRGLGAEIRLIPDTEQPGKAYIYLSGCSFA